MVVNVHAPSDKIISSTTYTEGEVGMWKENLAMQSFPTNAYGTIAFDGSLSKAAKYVRLGPKSDMSKVKELLTEHWGLTRPTPHLVLSIIGGAKNFKLDGRKKEVFKRGLIGETTAIDMMSIVCSYEVLNREVAGAAKATNAWVVTGGTNTGVMQLAGEAVRDGQFLVNEGSSSMKRGLKCIGICPWGYIHNTNALVNEQMGEFHAARYNSSTAL